MIIDIHVHSQPKRNMPAPHSDTWFATPWELIEAYDHGGVDKAVLLPCTNPENVHMIQSNEEVIGIWEDYPDRFIPFCNIDPRQCFRTPDADLSYMMSWYKDLGCRGIGEVCANLYFSVLRRPARRQPLRSRREGWHSLDFPCGDPRWQHLWSD